MFRRFFRKIICFVLILFVTISFLPCIVQASNEGIMPLESIYEDVECYRDMQLTQNEDGSYSLWYRIYNYGGVQENTIIIPQAKYDWKNWLIMVYPDGSVKYIIPYNPSDNALNFYSYYLWNRWNIEFEGKGIQCSTYDFDTNSWGSFSKGNEFDVTWEQVFANNYLLSKGVYITYEKGGIPYSSCIDYQNLFTPNLNYKVGEGFRLYLRDFHGSTEINDTYSLEKSLTSIHFTVHNLQSNIDIISNMELLSYSDVAQDEEGQYYIDIKFEDLLSMLLQGNGDYLFTFASNLRSDKYVNAFNNENCTMTTNYQSVDYFRFKWFADSNSGLLVPCYEDGTEKPRRWRRGQSSRRKRP